MLTAGSLAALQELIASWLARDRSKHGHYFSSRVPKMAAYGALISAPLGHFLIKILQKMFSGRTSLRAKILQILVSNLIVRPPASVLPLGETQRQLTDACLQVSPIQNTVYLAAMAIIAGARTFHQVRATIRAGFFPVMKFSWIASPIALAFAQQFLPESTWVPFFNIVAFVIGTYINTHTKKKRLAALRRKVTIPQIKPHRSDRCTVRGWTAGRLSPAGLLDVRCVDTCCSFLCSMHVVGALPRLVSCTAVCHMYVATSKKPSLRLSYNLLLAFPSPVSLLSLI